MNLWRKLNDPNAPHEDISIQKGKRIPFDGALVAVWTENFDCDRETQYWYCVKDTALDIDALKAKRRYEINKGRKNFTTKVINSSDYADELYQVYVSSLKGYKGNPTPLTREVFESAITGWQKKECILFATFENETGKMVGYSDIYYRPPYIPISSLKTNPDFERKGVNFSLVYTICKYFEKDMGQGCFLCDGVRNSSHETNFQDFLIKYFGFRKAYCDLHISYRWFLKPVIMTLFPVRKHIKGKIPALYSLLKMEAWSRGINET